MECQSATVYQSDLAILLVSLHVLPATFKKHKPKYRCFYRGHIEQSQFFSFLLDLLDLKPSENRPQSNGLIITMLFF